MNREIKFQVFYKSNPFGEERVVNGNWTWRSYELTPVGKWLTGVFPYNEDSFRREYTGLKDKNEKEIYEKDLVKSGNSIGVIEFEKGLFGINWDYGTDKKSMLGSWGTETNLRRIDDGFNREIEIIGNIYEHPHLLNPSIQETK